MTRQSTVRDSTITLITSLSVIALNMLLAGILSRYLQKEQYSDYLFIRRFIAVVFPFTSISIGVGLTRELAKSTQDSNQQQVILNGSFVILTAFTILVSGILFLLPASAIRTTIFPLHSNSADIIWYGTLIWLIFYNSYIFLYSTYRGNLNMNKANLANFLVNGLAPISLCLLLILNDSLTIRNIVFLVALTFALTLPFNLLKLKKTQTQLASGIRTAYKTVLTYCMPRIPAGILLSVMPFILPLFLEKSGQRNVYFLTGLLVVQAVFYFSEPLAHVFLPRSSLWFEQNEIHKINKLLTIIISSTLFIGFVVSSQVYIWGDIVALRWFGPGYEQAGLVIQYLAPAIIPAFLYPPFRSILDGIERKPLITTILLTSVLICSLLTVAFYLLGCLTLLSASAILCLYHMLNAGQLAVAIHKRVAFNVPAKLILESILITIIPAAGGVILHNLCNKASIIQTLAALAGSASLTLATLAIWYQTRRKSGRI